MSSAASLIVGAAGHIDHGKTTLVRALTGIDADRLPEEKRRGITIDLGFASTEFEVADGSRVRLSFIDVPGHRLFIRNMLAGAGGIDCVMLAVSAEDGVMPQTEEHLAICGLLGIQCGLVALTKTDLVSEERFAEVREQVAAFTASTFLRGAPVVAVSAFTGSGLPELRSQLARFAAQKPPRASGGQLRLPLDRAFVMKGFGTVVTGTLQSGFLERGQALTIEPGGLLVKVRGLQIHGRSETSASAGSRVAVNLTGVEVADAHRGATLAQPHSLEAVIQVDAEVSLSADAAELRHRATVRFHCFSAEAIATILTYSDRAIQPGSSAIIRLKLRRPIVLLPGDRFVLRRLSPAQTIGGGRILDAHPIPRTRKAAAVAWLGKISHAGAEQQTLLRIARRGAAGISTATLTRETGLTRDAVSGLIRPSLQTGQLVSAGGLLLSAAAFASAQELVIANLMQMVGKSGPASAGIKRSGLRNHTGLAPEVFDAVLGHLADERKLLVAGNGATDLIALYEASAQLPEADAKGIAAISAAYKSAGLQAPLFIEAIQSSGLNPNEARRLITLLLRNKTLVKLGTDDLFMHQTALAQLQNEMKKLRGQSLDVARFKHLTGLSRKYAIPLLEYLDRERVTRKQGDSRLVL